VALEMTSSDNDIINVPPKSLDVIEARRRRTTRGTLEQGGEAGGRRWMALRTRTRPR